MKFQIFLLTFVTIFGLISSNDEASQWEEFKRIHDKKYNRNEDIFRRAIFRKRLAQVKRTLDAYEKGSTTHYLELNEFSDMTNDERSEYVKAKFRNSNSSINPERSNKGISAIGLRLNSTNPIFHVYTADSATLPNCVDLRSSGWKEPVRHQGSCGCCWAISISTLVSFQNYNQSKVSDQLSPQHLVDCAGVYGATGCHGGSPIHGLMYIAVNNQTFERNYPYKGIQGECNLARLKSAPSHKINGFLLVNSNQESIKQCVAKIGPVSVSIAADHLFDYGGGVWDGTNSITNASCELSKINHAVTIVGYCTNSTTNQSYWIIKNSWGSSWGEKGYFRMLMNNTNLCGLWKYPYAVY